MVTEGDCCRIQDCHLLWWAIPDPSASNAFVTPLGSRNPGPKPGLGYVRLRSPLLTESRLISFPPGTEMCQFPGFARTGLYIQPAVTPSPCGMTPGFPIRTSPDQCSFANSPELFAGYHVLHRLSTPRHPPCTLNSLIVQMTGCRLHRHVQAPVTHELRHLEAWPRNKRPAARLPRSKVSNWCIDATTCTSANAAGL